MWNHYFWFCCIDLKRNQTMFPNVNDWMTNIFNWPENIIAPAKLEKSSNLIPSWNCFNDQGGNFQSKPGTFWGWWSSAWCSWHLNKRKCKLKTTEALADKLRWFENAKRSRPSEWNTSESLKGFNGCFSFDKRLQRYLGCFLPPFRPEARN